MEQARSVQVAPRESFEREDRAGREIRGHGIPWNTAIRALERQRKRLPQVPGSGNHAPCAGCVGCGCGNGPRHRPVSRMGCGRFSMGPCSRFWARNGAGQACARSWLAMSGPARAFFSAGGPRRPPASRKRPGPHRQQPSDRTWARRARYNYLFHQQVYACHVFRS